jgi:hypothetical protein
MRIKLRYFGVDEIACALQSFDSYFMKSGENYRLNDTVQDMK